MHHKLKERLFGGAVMVALTIIFVPMLFDQPVPPQVDPSSTFLPESPDWSEANEINVPDHWIVSDQASGQAEKTVIFNLPSTHVRTGTAETLTEQAPDKSSILDAKSDKVKAQDVVRKVWAVQLASFSEYTNAEDLAEKLRSSGYPAYTASAKSAKHTLWKVMVGPQVERESAQNVQTVLKTRFKLEGLVVPYDPVSG